MPATDSKYSYLTNNLGFTELVFNIMNFFVSGVTGTGLSDSEIFRHFAQK